MDSIRVVGYVSVKINDSLKEVYFETELTMTEDEFEKLSKDEIFESLEKGVDWDEWFKIQDIEYDDLHVDLNSVEIEDYYKVDPETGVPFN